MRTPLIVASLLLTVALISACQPPTLYSPRVCSQAPPDPAAEVLERFFAASGGLAPMRDMQSISCSANIAAFDYQYEMHLLDDGRFCIEAPDRTTVHDGNEYWQSFHGLVQPTTGEERERYEEVSLDEIFLHGFLDSRGRLAELEYAGQESRRGESWDLLKRTDANGDRQTFYLNTQTGLLDKIIELSPDPDYRELKTVYTLGEYEEFAGRKLPTLMQAQCLTNGEAVQPLTRFSDFRINAEPDPALFTRPTSAAPPARRDGDALHGQVLAISGGGSLITSITEPDFETLGVAAGDIVAAEVKGHESHLVYAPVLQGQIEPGDYLATFNRTPALWLVKAYVGMTSDDSTYAAGDAVRLWSAAESEEGEAR